MDSMLREVKKRIPEEEINEAKAQRLREQQDQSKFHWNELPAEIRNMIYRYTLVRARPIILRCVIYHARIFYSHRINHNKRKNGWLAPNLLLVDRRTYDEGTPMLYGNQVHFECGLALWMFLVHLRRARRLITTIKVGFMSERFLERAFRLLLGLPNLQSVEIIYLSCCCVDHRSPMLIVDTCRVVAPWFASLGATDSDRKAAIREMLVVNSGWDTVSELDWHNDELLLAIIDRL